MKHKQKQESAPEQSVYQTGNAVPQDRHRGLYTALVIVTILLVCVISVMSLLNIRIFRRMQQLSSNENAFRLASDAADSETRPSVSPSSDRWKIPDQPLQLQFEAAPPAPQSDLSLQDIYRKNIPGVVSVSGEGGCGSGVVLSESGYLLTDSSLLGDNRFAEVKLHDGRTLTAWLVGADPLSELAVLNAEIDGLTPVCFADDAQVQVGDTVVAIGDPLGSTLPGTMSSGIVSAVNRDLQVDGRSISLLQTNAPLGSGNTGGPLLNSYGQVVGINTDRLGRLLSQNQIDCLGFAIPSSVVKEVVDQLLTQGYVPGSAMLGFSVEPVTAFDQLYYRVPAGLFITSAEKAAPLQTGDILLSLSGCRVGSTEDLQACLTQYRSGDTVSLTIYRSGETFEVAVTLSSNE